MTSNDITLKRQDFNFHLPKQQIADFPSENRSDSRLLYLNRQANLLTDQYFHQLTEFLSAGDLLVFNDTKVIPARLFGNKPSGGKVEILIERIMDNQQVLAQLRANRTLTLGSVILLEGNITAEVIGRREDFFILQFNLEQSILTMLNDIGHIPLPPYIDRMAVTADKSRYQTIYAKHDGAVAAPTAGLHFDENLFQQLQQKNINTAFITLHVGAGTFQPMRVDNLDEHIMHAEYVEVGASVCDKIIATRRNSHRVIAVGTTVVRALETAACSGKLTAFSGETDIFITPGYQFNSIDGLITNFHLPESTLLMLVAALAALETTLDAYQHAVTHNYRFYSYGDAMLIL